MKPGLGVRQSTIEPMLGVSRRHRRATSWLGDTMSLRIADTALAASLNAGLPDWTGNVSADGQQSPAHRAVTTPAPNVPTGWPPGRICASSATIALRWSIGRR